MNDEKLLINILELSKKHLKISQDILRLLKEEHLCDSCKQDRTPRCWGKAIVNQQSDNVVKCEEYRERLDDEE